MFALEITVKPETLPVARPSRFNGGNNPWKSPTPWGILRGTSVFRIKNENLIENENIHRMKYYLNDMEVRSNHYRF